MTLTQSNEDATLPRGQRQCKATANSTGERCRQPAIRGADVCRIHGGSAPQVKAAAKRRLALQEGLKGVAALVAEHGLPEPDDRHPAEQLMRALTLSTMMVEALAVTAEKIDAKPGHEVFEAWERERDRHTRIAKTILDAGIAERQVKILEAQAHVFARSLLGVLKDLGIDTSSDETLNTVRRHMMAMEVVDV